MDSFGNLIIIYLLGGLTFFPLLLSLALIYAYLTFPDASSLQRTCAGASDAVRRPTDDEFSLKSQTDHLVEEFHRAHDSDVAAGYFAVCREYVPGGVNGKPPERTTPAGEVVAAESPSVYQAMYRSLFDRKQAPSIEPAKANGKNTKRARNIFYIVLRHGHLMLYDDANQVEVRYVISLAHHDVSIFGGEGEIPEGELWIKRNAICLSRRLDSLGDLGGPTPPFYLFSENLSEKEDFYFAMLQNQSKMRDSANHPPKHQSFDVRHIVTLVQRLHSSEEQLQTRWINAFLGRLFLALYRTPAVEELIRNKITKKISRINKPGFISKVGLQRIDMGEGAPFVTNPRLKDLTADGNCCIEADIQYTGNFCVEISATVRIDLGSRFKPREVDIVLAVVLKKLEGHLLVRFKPPPSNRFWMSFETMPIMSMDVQPIVSSKQVTFSPILRAIESKIREVVAESIVLPFWDDMPFLDTTGQKFRGGIWLPEASNSDAEVEIPDESGQPAVLSSQFSVESDGLQPKDGRTMSMPALAETVHSKVRTRRGPKSLSSDAPTSTIASSSGIDRLDNSPLPRAIRSQTFSHAADPIVTADNAKFNKASPETKSDEKSTATSAMIEISSRSPPTSPQRISNASFSTGVLKSPESAVHSRGSSIAESLDEPSVIDDHARPISSSVQIDDGAAFGLQGSQSGSTTSLSSEKSRRRGTIETLTKSFTNTLDDKTGNMNFGAATAAAKKWGWNVFNKSELSVNQEKTRPLVGTPDEPIGRGHPHPPPGAPLPRPDKYALRMNPKPGNLPRRKPIEASPPERPSLGSPLALPRRKPIPPTMYPGGVDEVLVVQAPRDSVPNSPVVRDSDLSEDTPSLRSSSSEIPSQTYLVNETAASSEQQDSGGQEAQLVQYVDHTSSSSPETGSEIHLSRSTELLSV